MARIGKKSLSLLLTVLLLVSLFIQAFTLVFQLSQIFVVLIAALSFRRPAEYGTNDFDLAADIGHAEGVIFFLVFILLDKGLEIRFGFLPAARFITVCEKSRMIYVVAKCHTILRSALNQALRWDYLRGNNPVMAVELPKSKRGKRNAWTDQEAKRALACCESPRLLLCMYLALGCSMRIGEILGLTWSCVHIENDLSESDDAFLMVDKELRRCDKASLERLRKSGNDDVFFEFPNCTQRDTRTGLVLKTPKTESSVRKISSHHRDRRAQRGKMTAGSLETGPRR